MSDSVRPHRWQPTKLPRLWDSPGKNTAYPHVIHTSSKHVISGDKLGNKTREGNGSILIISLSSIFIKGNGQDVLLTFNVLTLFQKSQLLKKKKKPGFPDSSVGKESTCNAGDSDLIPGWGRSIGERIGYPLQYSWASLVALVEKNLPAMRETWVKSLGWKDPLRREKAIHSSILAWKIPWTV